MACFRPKKLPSRLSEIFLEGFGTGVVDVLLDRPRLHFGGLLAFPPTNKSLTLQNCIPSMFLLLIKFELPLLLEYHRIL